jgi:hypothetical protein
VIQKYCTGWGKGEEEKSKTGELILCLRVNGIGEREKERVSQNEVRECRKKYYPSTPSGEGVFWAKRG